VRAIDVYDGVAKVVAPKQESLEKAEAELAEQMAKLHLKQAELRIVTEKLEGLESNLKRKQEEKQVGWFIICFINPKSWVFSYIVIQAIHTYLIKIIVDCKTSYPN